MAEPGSTAPIKTTIRKLVIESEWRRWRGPDDTGSQYFIRLEQIDDLFPGGHCLVYRDDEGFVAVSAADPAIWMRGLSRRCFALHPSLDAAPPFDLHFQG